jgi:PilZ domain
VDSNPPIEPEIDLQVERRADRQQVFVKARWRTSKWHVGDASLSDISVHGCCIGTRTTLVEGQAIDIRYGSNKGLPGTIRWVNGMSAGVEFDTPLNESEVEALYSEHQQNTANVSRLPLRTKQPG